MHGGIHGKGLFRAYQPTNNAHCRQASMSDKNSQPQYYRLPECDGRLQPESECAGREIAASGKESKKCPATASAYHISRAYRKHQSQLFSVMLTRPASLKTAIPFLKTKIRACATGSMDFHDHGSGAGQTSRLKEKQHAGTPRGNVLARETVAGSVKLRRTSSDTGRTPR